jgi:pimeloyl-ACP methyl ester carboxylesterase
MEMKKMLTIIFAIIGIVLGAMAIALLVVLILSPGKLPPLKDEQGKVIAGSISDKVFVEIGGVRQGMFIRSENPENPVILYVHGGPGEPALQFISALEKSERLEKYFTVCYWDQRGAGMSYSKSIDPSSINIDRMTDDAHEVTEYLKARFGKEKIYIVGQSWGTYLGVKTIEKYPGNYLAYIGVGQAADTMESERLSYAYMMKRAKEINDTEVIERLSKYDMDSFPWPDEGLKWFEYLAKARTNSLEKYGIGRLHRGVSFKDILQSFFQFKGYTLGEKINWFIGEDLSMVHLFPIVLNDNLFETSVNFEVPFYIIHGDYDYMTSQVIARKYMDAVSAPKKEYYAFPGSAHSPNMEEPEEFCRVVREIAAENPR